MYGPPPDAAQVLVEAPWGAWAFCGIVAVVALLGAVRARGGLQLALVTLGGLVGLTAPMAGMIGVAVVGSYPTIDKAGSLHFFREAVHRHLLDAGDPGVQLIGVHLGHLWVVQAFAALMPDWAGFNLESLLNVWLAWLCTAAWLEHRTGDRRIAVLLAIPFALNLHQFRDINWYTVEKTAIFVLPLWALCLDRGRRWACLGVGALAMFLNVYMGVLIAAMGAWWGLRAVFRRDRAGFACVVATAAGMLPFVVWQGVLMRGAHSPGSPEQFLTQRAALDIVSVVPWQWNRLEGWRAMSPAVLGLAAIWVWGEAIWRRSAWIIAGAVLATTLSFGPAWNPVYMALFEVLPGFWRVAKPETFFFVPWLLAVTAAASVLAGARLSNRAFAVLAVCFVAGWVAGVRGHPVYPDFYSRPPAAPGAR